VFKNIPLTLTTLGFTVALGDGCAAKHTDSSSSNNPGAVDEGADANQSESDTESLSTSLIGGDSTTLRLASASELNPMHDGQLQLDDLGDGAKGFYRPAGCLVVTADTAAKKVTYKFNDCTGPFGLVHITGEVDVTFSSSAANQLTLNFSATDLKINRGAIDWTATANVTANGLARDMVWDGHFTGTTAHGRAFQRTNHKEYKWTVGQQCLAVQGSSDGTVTGHELKTDVIDFQICKGGCPEAGSEIKVTDVTANKVYDLKWNAGDATYTGPDGRSITYTPLCAAL
jgi:hypothetical protein